jgi:Fur family peroxide stress response transcriptional regulator
MENRYEANTGDHLNLVCRSCGKIQDFMEDLTVSSRRIREQVGFQVQETRLEYYGYCQDCARSKK